MTERMEKDDKEEKDGSKEKAEEFTMMPALWNRLVLSLLAIALLWAASLRTAGKKCLSSS